jgi:clan AA aspartic protease
MMVGMVTSAGQVTLQLVIHGPAGRSEQVEAVIDTGFKGHLTLPPTLVAALGLPSRGLFHPNLADGSRILMHYHEAVVIWHGQPRTISALTTDTPPLIGMALLEGGRLTVDVIAAGPATIEVLA